MTEEETEIATRKYHALPVLPLSSGRFAILGPFSNDSGLAVRCICDAADLHNFLAVAMYEIANRPEPSKPERKPQSRRIASTDDLVV